MAARRRWGASPLGRFVAEAFGIRLAFSFVELLQASIVFNVSFIVQPVQRAFEAIPRQLGEAAAVSGLSVQQIFCRIELPLAWPGIPSDMVPRFVHTLGEFGVVLMMRVSIPGETKTKTTASRLSISRAPIASPGPAGRGQTMVRPFVGRELEVGGGRMYRFLGYP